MQPFFLYYGGKWRLAEKLGPPQRDHVIEPFAGSAGYSCFWEPKKVTLIERDPIVFGVWKFLKRVSPAELRRLPSDIRHVDEIACPSLPRGKIADWVLVQPWSSVAGCSPLQLGEKST